MNSAVSRTLNFKSSVRWCGAVVVQRWLSLSGGRRGEDVAEGGAGERPPVSKDQETYERDIRHSILEAALTFVPSHGWTKEAITAGAETLGYPGVVHGLCPRGGVDLVQHFYSKSNASLVERMQAEFTPPSPSTPPPKPRGQREMIEAAVRWRLEMVVPVKREWPGALGLMALPPNVPTSLANLLTLVDDILYHTGDKSVDMWWYGRRVGLAGVYKTTELYLLQDSSEDHQLTWRFLSRRLDDAHHLASVLAASGHASSLAQEVTASAFITARNLLGLTWSR